MLRFGQNQNDVLIFETDEEMTFLYNLYQMKVLLIICVVFSMSVGSLYSQTKTIKGRVITDELEIYPFTRIVVNDTVKVGETDLDGYFQVEIPTSANKILFMNIGMEPASIELLDRYQEIEVVLMSSCSYDFISLRKADRDRKKRFRRLPKLHKEAFEKGIFKTANAYYIQHFIPYHQKTKVR